MRRVQPVYLEEYASAGPSGGCEAQPVGLLIGVRRGVLRCRGEAGDEGEGEAVCLQLQEAQELPRWSLTEALSAAGVLEGGEGELELCG